MSWPWVLLLVLLALWAGAAMGFMFAAVFAAVFASRERS